MRYYLIFLLFLLCNCNSAIPSKDQPSQPVVSKWSNWKMPSPPKVDTANDKIDTLATTTHFYFITHNASISSAAAKQLAEKCEQTFEAIRLFTNNNKPIPTINYHIYNSIEQKALRLSKMEIAHSDPITANHYIVYNQYFKGHQLQHENILLLRLLLGKPLLQALEVGLSNHFTKKWYEKGYDYWAGLLYQSNNLPPFQELLDNDIFEKESNLVMGAMSGVFVDFLVQHLGKDSFLASYSMANKEDLLLLEEEWQQYLKERYKDFQKNHPFMRSRQLTRYQKGFNFAHEGYRIYNGYGSQLAKQSLARLKEIGNNSIAIVPYSFMRKPNQPSPLLINHGAGGENDESVLFSHYEAQAMGMQTMLKPQIWLRGSWPGDINMSLEKDWMTFFDYYYRWMRHYALLAEIHGFDSLCLGVEFAKATLNREQDWRQLIQQIKGIYQGPLTYAANWGEEFEQLQFWDELDFIGINCYYPLSEELAPSKRTLKRAFTEVAQKIEKVAQTYNKPIVFTEIGFRSVEKTWANPHEGAKGRAFSEKCQSLAYEVVFETVQDKDWCQGLFWWKWPSYLAYGGEQNTGFSPTGKEAEQVVAKWYLE